MGNDSEVFDYLRSNRDHFKATLAPLIKKREALLVIESVVFYEEITEQYEAEIRESIAGEICARHGIDYETVICVLEDLDIDAYLQY